MPYPKHTYRGRKVYISSSKFTDDWTKTKASAASYKQINGVGNVGSYGNDTNILNYDTLEELVTSKQKGVTDAGSPVIEVARDDTDDGQTALRTAGAPDDFDYYAFKVTNQDGSTDYLLGVVTGPVNQGGGNEDFDLDHYTVGVSANVIHVPKT